MTNQEKAKHFMALLSAGDNRCEILLMMLGIATCTGRDDSIAKITQIAQGDI